MGPQISTASAMFRMALGVIFWVIQRPRCATVSGNELCPCSSITRPFVNACCQVAIRIDTPREVARREGNGRQEDNPATCHDTDSHRLLEISSKKESASGRETANAVALYVPRRSMLNR